MALPETSLEGTIPMVARREPASLTLEAHQLQLLLAGGDSTAAKGIAIWRQVQEKT